jgi:hypothetical protein
MGNPGESLLGEGKQKQALFSLSGVRFSYAFGGCNDTAVMYTKFLCVSLERTAFSLNYDFSVFILLSQCMSRIMESTVRNDWTYICPVSLTGSCYWL